MYGRERKLNHYVTWEVIYIGLIDRMILITPDFLGVNEAKPPNSYLN